MPAPDLDRICNIAGYPMYPWAISQLQMRSQQGSKSVRDDDNLNYQANFGAWVRLISSVNLEPDFLNYFKEITSQLGAGNADDLAKTYVLYGGTSTYASATSMNLRSGVGNNGLYGMLGDKEIQDFGYKPTPGITNVTIDTSGRMGSLRQATINFKVWDKYQLDIMDALYFRPGFTVLLEYGHARYYDNHGNIQSSEQFMIPAFNNGKSNELSIEDINIRIGANTQKSYGNYGGMLGVITQFSFSLTHDGGYDCTIKAMALGSVLSDFSITHLSNLPGAYISQLQRYLNTEKSKKLAELRKQFDDQKIKNLNELTNNSSKTDNWENLKITDEFTNLIHYFRPFELKNANSAKLPAVTTVDNTGVTTVVPQPLKNVNTSPLFFENTEDVKNQITQFIINYKNNFLNKELTSNSDITVYKIDDRQSGNKNVIFIESNNPNTNKKYLYADEKNPIYVKLDPEYIKIILSNSSGKTSAGKPHDIIIQKINSAGDIIPNEFYSDWLDAIYSFYDSNRGTKQSNVLVNNKLGVSVVSYANSGIEYNLGAKYNNYQSAKQLFNNKDTQYKVVAIEKNGLSNNYIIKIVAIGVTTGDEYSIIFDDVSFITDIIGNQDITKNKLVSEELAIEQQAATAYSNAIKDLNIEFSAETLKATIQGESALELMLRSIILFTLNNPDPAKIKDKTFSEFIKTLFSEGAYTPFFNSDSLIQNKPNNSEYEDGSYFTKYMTGGLTKEDRLKTNLKFGNNYYLMSGENAYDTNGNLKNLLTSIPQVDFKSLFDFKTIPYGQSIDIEVSEQYKKQISVYIPLGLFFMMLNHTAILYTKESKNAFTSGSILTPMTYIDFNPSTNYYLSSKNQFSIDPYKFLTRFSGNDSDYAKLFDKDLIPNYVITPKDSLISGSAVISSEPLFRPETQDIVTPYLPNNKKTLNGQDSNEYCGRLMEIDVNINYLLEVIRKQRSAETNEVYFQSVIEYILNDLNKSMGNYNAFRLSYNDSSNCFIITDDQLQIAPDVISKTSISNMIQDPVSYGIPLLGHESIAKTFSINTDMSSRIASMLAISSNPVTRDQVLNGKNTSDFGVYNTGSYDRYAGTKTGGDPNTKFNPSLQKAEAAINFNHVVKSIYTDIGIKDLNSQHIKISDESLNRALAYYIDRMGNIKNEQSGSLHAMIIPLKSNIVMDGMSGIYPFQLYTVDERILPYRYSSKNLSTSQLDQRRIAFSIARMTHTIDSNQWTTSVEGFMTLLRNAEGQKTRDITSKPIDITQYLNATTNAPTITKSKTDFVKTYYPIAKIAGKKGGIDPIIILAQAAHESAWGNSNLAQNYNAFFGITAGKGYTGKTHIGDNEYALKFRAYNSPQESFDDFVDLIKTDKRYVSSYQAVGNYKEYAYQISYSPYITEENGDRRPVYQSSIISNYEAILAILKKENIT